MALIRWQPFQEFDTLRRQMDEMFDQVMVRERQSATSWQPAIELQDTEENLVLRAEIPGADGKDIDIHVTREAIAISGERRFEQHTQAQGFFRSEFRYGNFQRVIPLPMPVQNEQAYAEFKDGILTLTLPKVSEARRTVVKLNLDNTTSVTPKLTSQSDEIAGQAAMN